jgi:hypothetical protein
MIEKKVLIRAAINKIIFVGLDISDVVTCKIIGDLIFRMQGF